MRPTRLDRGRKCLVQRDAIVGLLRFMHQANRHVEGHQLAAVFRGLVV